MKKILIRTAGTLLGGEKAASALGNRGQETTKNRIKTVEPHPLQAIDSPSILRTWPEFRCDLLCCGVSQPDPNPLRSIWKSRFISADKSNEFLRGTREMWRHLVEELNTCRLERAAEVCSRERGTSEWR